MRVAQGKGNDARKILTYYRVNFGIKAPYRVLCDGALIHQALQQKLYLRESLHALLGESAQAVVTRCVLDELRSLGEPASAAALFAKRLTRTPCAHAGSLPAADCIAAAVRAGNTHRLMVATCDARLRRVVEKEPGVPTVRVLDGRRFVLAPPNQATLDAVARAEVGKSAVRRPDEVRRLEEESEERRALWEERKAARPKKRKKPSGPNPLSVKKSKRVRENGAARKEALGGDGGKDGGVEEVEGSAAGDEAEPIVKKKTRVRKRKPKPKKDVPKDAVVEDKAGAARGTVEAGAPESGSVSGVEAVAGDKAGDAIAQKNTVDEESGRVDGTGVARETGGGDGDEGGAEEKDVVRAEESADGKDAMVVE